ncbi:hypothetical protein GC176_02370 [bacterium]|nr:hypothetical protein [bacterium]
MVADASILGRFVWHDLITTDVGSAVDFYGRLFPEWSIEKLETDGGSRYHVIEVAGQDIGGIVGVPAESGIPAHWIGYVAVEDCDAAVKRTIDLGGNCLVPAIDVPQIGRFAIVQDPRGAVIKPFHVQKQIEFPAEAVVGRAYWNELLTKDVGSARDFYRSVFGWSSVEQPIEGRGVYTLFRAGEQDVAGVLLLPPDSDASQTWLTYFYADDLDPRANSVEVLGGQVIVKPQDIPDVGRFSVLADPAGALFALMRGESNES